MQCSLLDNDDKKGGTISKSFQLYSLYQKEFVFYISLYQLKKRLFTVSIFVDQIYLLFYMVHIKSSLLLYVENIFPDRSSYVTRKRLCKFELTSGTAVLIGFSFLAGKQIIHESPWILTKINTSKLTRYLWKTFIKKVYRCCKY